jgi:hypothetical protein
MIPESPFPLFKVTFEVPSRGADEIVERVTKPAEKVFNGLPGLLSLESETLHERAVIDLLFKENTSPNTAYLYVQEKLDRVNLLMPRDVKTTKVERVTIKPEADIHLIFSKAQPLSKISSSLSPIRSAILETQPNIEKRAGVRVAPQFQRMLKEGISVSQIVNSLKLAGLSSVIGRQDGVMFGTGMTFEQIEDVKSTPVGARGHRVIRVMDVAEVDLQLPEPIKELKVWLDHNKLGAFALYKTLSGLDSQSTSNFPNWRAVRDQSLQPLIAIIFLFLFQIVLFRVIFSHTINPLSLLTFDGLLIVHFGFWKGMVAGNLTVLDLHSLVLTITVGTVFWVLLLSRIRTYFLPEDQIRRPPKTVAQATLFSMAELIPTFILLLLCLWLVSLPLLTTGLNLPSRHILSGFFYVGVPVLLFMLLFVPSFSDYSWLEKGEGLPKAKFNWKLKKRLSTAGMWGVMISAITSLCLFIFFPVGVSGPPKESFALKMIQELRGYSENLLFLTDKEESRSLYFVSKNESQLTREWTFSPGAMRFLPKLDLMSFGSALDDLKAERFFGFLEIFNEKLPISYQNLLIDSDEVSSLFIGSKIEGLQGRKLKVLADINYSNKPSKIMRSQLQTNNVVTVPNRSLNSSPPEGTTPTSWSAFIIEQLRSYQHFHSVSLLFLFLALSLYLNSFFRGATVLVFCTAPMALVYLMRCLIPGYYHVDSLWFLYFAPWTSVLILLVISRIGDIERSRGYDRDLCVEEIRKNYAPSVSYSVWFIVVALGFMGATEWIPFIPTLGVWKEALFLSVAVGVLAYLTNRILFPLFYFTSEELLDTMLLRIYRIISLRALIKKK